MFSSSVAVAAPSSGIALRGSWAGPSSRTDDWFTAGRRKMVVPLGDPDPRVPSAGPARPAAQEATANVLGEDLFRSVLSRERKRADRFDDVFALVTITLGNGSASPATDPRFELVISALAASTRGADVVGWVEEGAVLGVIFADLGSPAKEVARQTQARVQQNLTDRLDPSQLASLGVQWYVHLGPGAEGAHGLADTDPLLADIRSSQRRRSVLDALKRAFDIAGSLALLLILSPVFLALAALVKLTSEGPVLFRQGRVGLMATPFTMLKFRSMYTKSDSAIHQKFVTDFIKSGSQQRPEQRRTDLQDRQRPARDAARRNPAQDQSRRAAAALERAARRHVTGRTPPAAALRARAVPSVALAARARGQAWRDRAVAGRWSEPHDVRRNGPARPPLRQDPFALDGHQDPAGDPSRSCHRKRGLLRPPSDKSSGG